MAKHKHKKTKMIRVSEEVYMHIYTHTLSYMDTFDSVLRRLLKIKKNK